MIRKHNLAVRNYLVQFELYGCHWRKDRIWNNIQEQLVSWYRWQENFHLFGDDPLNSETKKGVNSLLFY